MPLPGSNSTTAFGLIARGRGMALAIPVEAFPNNFNGRRQSMCRTAGFDPNATVLATMRRRRHGLGAIWSSAKIVSFDAAPAPCSSPVPPGRRGGRPKKPEGPTLRQPATRGNAGCRQLVPDVSRCSNLSRGVRVPDPGCIRSRPREQPSHHRLHRPWQVADAPRPTHRPSRAFCSGTLPPWLAAARSKTSPSTPGRIPKKTNRLKNAGEAGMASTG